MGTRSNTIIKDEKGNIILNLYRQMDGYFSGHGKDLLDFISKGKLVDGYSFDQQYQFGKVFNGMGDFACQLITHLKRDEKVYDHNSPTGYGKKKSKRIGGFYIVPANEGVESFNYEIGVKDGQLYLKADGSYEVEDDYIDTNGLVEVFPNMDPRIAKEFLPKKKKKKKSKSV